MRYAFTLFLCIILATAVVAAPLTGTRTPITQTPAIHAPLTNTTLNTTGSSSGIRQLTTLPLSTSNSSDDKKQVPNIVVLRGPFVYLVTQETFGDKTTILAFDTSRMKIVGKMTPTHGVQYIALSPDGSVLYALDTIQTSETNYYGGTDYVQHMWITAIDTTSFKEKWSKELGKNIMSRRIAVSPDDRVYISWQRVGDSKPGYDVFDFNTNKHWSQFFGDGDADNMINSFDFSKYGSQVYMGTYQEYGEVYKLDWPRDEFTSANFWGHGSTVTSAVASGKSGMLYVGGESTNISVVNVNDLTRQSWRTDYRTNDLKVSPDGDTLYVIGRSLDYETHTLHRYTGLVDTASFLGENEWSVTDPSSFYTSENSATLTIPANTGAWRMALTPDGGNIYVIVAATNQGDDADDSLKVYDSQTLIETANIPIPSLTGNIAIGPKPIRWNWTDTISIPSSGANLHPQSGYFLSLEQSQPHTRKTKLEPIQSAGPKRMSTLIIPSAVLPSNESAGKNNTDDKNNGPQEEDSPESEPSEKKQDTALTGTGGTFHSWPAQNNQDNIRKSQENDTERRVSPLTNGTSGTKDAAQSNSTNANTATTDNRGFFGTIADFFARLFGRGKD